MFDVVGLLCFYMVDVLTGVIYNDVERTTFISVIIGRRMHYEVYVDTNNLLTNLWELHAPCSQRHTF